MAKEIGFLVIGAIFSWLIARYYFTRKKKWSEKISDLDNHLKYISKIRRSSIELNRQAFRFVFLILALMSAGFVVDSLPDYMGLGEKSSKLISFIVPLEFIIYFSAALFAFFNFRTFNDVINYEKAAKRIEVKRKRYQAKLEEF